MPGIGQFLEVMVLLDGYSRVGGSMSAGYGRREFMAAFGAAVAWPITCTPALGQPALSSGSSGANPYHPFPYAGSTGVPAGTVLTPSGGFTVSTSNQTYTALDIDDTVTIASGGTNATFQNCRITVGNTANWAINNSAGASGLTVRNCTFVGAGVNSTVVNYAIQPDGQIKIAFVPAPNTAPSLNPCTCIYLNASASTFLDRGLFPAAGTQIAETHCWVVGVCNPDN
jgi:hypothetical protein